MPTGPCGCGWYQWARAPAAPAPVMERTSISAAFTGSDFSFDSTVPSQPARKPSGTETRAGLS